MVGVYVVLRLQGWESISRNGVVDGTPRMEINGEATGFAPIGWLPVFETYEQAMVAALGDESLVITAKEIED